MAFLLPVALLVAERMTLHRRAARHKELRAS
jgi:hypothetical protein